ncbi:DNA polymerase IV [Oceanospirillum sediminis]|uniref:DNA polymerase IV n=1 Tax=Oceanospirillum sediminis TaxID=2760088 RepID=A0A839IQX1_9GAMM|nr:DNA polymerase IV [Oceanospirillum sediminis]MBB1487893.1 DNA polymerase IV [Oceanospirillum sediminis]
MRKIIHADCDCFFAAVEMRDNPDLKDKPVAVGGAADKRGVISTCNYAARAWGVRSAMPTAQALRLCPQLILCPSRMPVYKETAAVIREIFFQLTDRVEVVSIDEAYLDVSQCELFQGSATRIAQRLKQEVVSQTGITISVGISVNKFLAKVASDWQKPDGLFVIHPEDINGFMPDLAVRKIPGVGAVTAEKLAVRGIENCGQLQAVSLSELTGWFGKSGGTLYERCRGIDYREVTTERIRKSISVERTFACNLKHPDEMIQVINNQLLPELIARASPYASRRVRGFFLKVRFADFSVTTVDHSISDSCMKDILASLGNSELFQSLLRDALQRGPSDIRLLGTGFRLQDEGYSVQQLSLF